MVNAPFPSPETRHLVGWEMLGLPIWKSSYHCCSPLTIVSFSLRRPSVRNEYVGDGEQTCWGALMQMWSPLEVELEGLQNTATTLLVSRGLGLSTRCCCGFSPRPTWLPHCVTGHLCLNNFRSSPRATPQLLVFCPHNRRAGTGQQGYSRVF